jgi:hypothetical protein
MEDDYKGHLGRRDAGYRNVQDHFQDNPGGHAVVWAEENSRDAIFEGIRRKETYATSGTRLVVRFFGGWHYDDALCERADIASAGYQGGVAMGGDLPAAPTDGAPRFLVNALKDPGVAGRPGADLAAIQVVKGWVDAAGDSHERVFDVVGEVAGTAGSGPLGPVRGLDRPPLRSGAARLLLRARAREPDLPLEHVSMSGRGRRSLRRRLFRTGERRDRARGRGRRAR